MRIDFNFFYIRNIDLSVNKNGKTLICIGPLF